MSNTPTSGGGPPGRESFFETRNSPARIELDRIKSAFKKGVIAELEPDGYLQQKSAVRIAELLWKLRRLSRIDIGELLMAYAQARDDARNKLLEWARQADLSSQGEITIPSPLYEQAIALAAKAPSDAKPGAKRVLPEVATLWPDCVGLKRAGLARLSMSSSSSAR